MPQSPKLSVFITNYNHGFWLPRALDSVCTQEDAPDEVLVLDDCSSDGSLAIVREYSRKYPFVRYHRYEKKSEDWVREAVRNQVLVTGDYISWLAADDIVYPGFVRAMREVMTRFPEAGVICPAYHHLGPNDAPFRTSEYQVSETCCLTGKAVADHMTKPGVARAGGIGTAMRMDAVRWLLPHGWEDLSVNMDHGWIAIGLKYGIVYLPQVLGGYTDYSPTAFHEQTMRHPTRCLDCFQQVRAFWRQPALADLVTPELINHFEQSVIVTFPPQTQQLVQGQQFLQSGNLAMARQVFHGLVQKYPTFAQAWECLGVACYRLGQVNDAEYAFFRAILFNPTSAVVCNNLGVCHQAQGRLQKALCLFLQAIDISPNYVEAHTHLAAVLASLQRFDEAKAACKRALELNPNCTPARDQLAQLAQIT